MSRCRSESFNKSLVQNCLNLNNAGQCAATTEGFTSPSFGHLSKAVSTLRIAPKLQQNPLNGNNLRPSTCKKAPNHGETVNFYDGYNAKIENTQLDYILVKHGHQWKIEEIDLKGTKDASNHLLSGIPEQIRTRLTSENREKLLTNIRMN